jgi:hypothetical protein
MGQHQPAIRTQNRFSLATRRTRSEREADRQNSVVIGGMERCRGDLESPADDEPETVMDGEDAEYDARCDVEQRVAFV